MVTPTLHLDGGISLREPPTSRAQRTAPVSPLATLIRMVADVDQVARARRSRRYASLLNRTA
jgi:hypothetical protein